MRGSADLRWGWRHGHGQYIIIDVSVHNASDGGHLRLSAARAMGSLRVGACLDTVHSGTVACAHCRQGQQAANERRDEGTLGRVVIPQHHSLLGPFRPEPATGRSLSPHNLRKRERNQVTSPNGRRGWTTGRSGATHLACPAAQRESAWSAYMSAPEVRSLYSLSAKWGWPGSKQIGFTDALEKNVAIDG